KHFDAYAHHPYYNNRFERPTTVPTSKKAVTLGNIRVLIEKLNSLYGPKRPLWITEDGLQTRPPDRRFGVPDSLQAKYVHQAVAIARKTRRGGQLGLVLSRRVGGRVAGGGGGGSQPRGRPGLLSPPSVRGGSPNRRSRRRRDTRGPGLATTCYVKGR